MRLILVSISNMNNTVKVNLSITLPGSVMLSQQAAENTPNSFDEFKVEVSGPKGEDIEVLTVQTRKCAPASQSLNISKDAYDAMIDKELYPYWCKAGTWAGMNDRMRLEAHLKRIAEGLGGTSFTYQVFKD